MSKKIMWTARVPQPDGTTRTIELMFYKPDATKEQVLHRWTVTAPVKFFRGVDPSRIVLEGPYEPNAKNLAEAAAVLKQPAPAVSTPKPTSKE